MRLQNCTPDLLVISSKGTKEISAHGLKPSASELAKTKPGSPNCLVDSIICVKSSFVVSSLTKRTELLERPRCGFSLNQFPVFAVSISLSFLENKAIVALLLTPPEITASAACIRMS